MFRNSTSSKLAKSIITRLTNKQNLGGIRLIRGYHSVDQQLHGVGKEKMSKSQPTDNSESQDDAIDLDTSTSESDNEDELDDGTDSSGDRRIDHLVFVVPG